MSHTVKIQENLREYTKYNKFLILYEMAQAGLQQKRTKMTRVRTELRLNFNAKHGQTKFKRIEWWIDNLQLMADAIKKGTGRRPAR